MNSSNKISVLQLCILLTMTIGLANHVTVIPLLLQTAKRDAWISVLAAFVFFIAWIWIPFAIARKTNQANLVDWLKSHVGVWFARLMQCAAAVYLFSIAFIALKETATWTKVSYLPQTPLLVIVASLMMLCCYTASKGIQSIAITAGVLLPFVMILGYFVMGANFQYKRYNLLFPMITSDLSSIAQCMIYIGGGFIELIIVVLMQHLLSRPVKWVHLFALLSVMCGLTLGPLMGSIAAFGPEEAAILRYPAYEQWRLVTIGDYVAHVDFFSIYQWLSGSFIRVSLSIFLIIDLFQIRQPRRRQLIINLISICLFLLCLLPISDMTYVAYIHDYYAITFYAALAVSLILITLVVVKSKKKGRSL
ncbi:GerAB/ArcD/ProY family transporter [Paenibacillus sp. UNC451MF]|uniref:GerAB/ArcD/ProY family transporter n=1 Tax=Paenibacillus sp. UNC451MF TaxID=1449063 RepID=UPI00048E9105|nr:endospore germination permease [Paenibacillus sp. UNC451MF]